MDCSACLSCGMVVLLVMTGCRLFHIFMVLGKKDVCCRSSVIWHLLAFIWQLVVLVAIYSNVDLTYSAKKFIRHAVERAKMARFFCGEYLRVDTGSRTDAIARG